MNFNLRNKKTAYVAYDNLVNKHDDIKFGAYSEEGIYIAFKSRKSVCIDKIAGKNLRLRYPLIEKMKEGNNCEIGFVNGMNFGVNSGKSGK